MVETSFNIIVASLEYTITEPSELAEDTEDTEDAEDTETNTTVNTPPSIEGIKSSYYVPRVVDENGVPLDYFKS